MKNYKYFLVLCFFTFFLGELAKYVLNTNTLLYNTLVEKLSFEQVEQAFSKMRKWQLLSYILIPLIILIKTHLIASILSIGTFFFNTEITYKKLWKIVLKAEFVYLVPIILKIIWFYFFQTNYNLEDLQYFYPLSVLNIIDYEGLQPWFIYPLQVLNLFELVYWLVLAYLIDKELGVEKTKDTGIIIVASSYGVSLLIWVVGVMFFTLNMS